MVNEFPHSQGELAAAMTSGQNAAAGALRLIAASDLDPRRSDIVVSIWEFDEDDAARIGWAAKINPPEIVASYATELKHLDT